MAAAPALLRGLDFVFAVHNHQPVGNFETVVAEAFENCYRPFLERAAEFPDFRFSAHYSGPLWDYMMKCEPATFELIKALAARGQVELLSGGYYEPILSIIPERDAVGQVLMMNEFIEKHFCQRPRGLWLTERVWEPALPRTLAATGIEYTLVDEEHFHYAGVGRIHRTYLTENEGSPLRLFPIDKTLRYLIPFRPLEDLEAHLAGIREDGGTAILGDDGEKFGVWPGTKKWVFEDGWLARFFAFIAEKGLRMRTCSEHLESCAPAGRVYLPPASYEEMTEWVLEPDEAEAYRALRDSAPAEARRFLRGGYFPDFFRKYVEANHLHKRMLHVSAEVHAAKAGAEVRTELYRGQCNDPYWHGVFGGLYLPHLREAVYEHLLRAEKGTPATQGWTPVDYDLDGRLELFARGRTFNLLAKPAYGGSLVEIDDLPRARNLSDVLSRREETYQRVKAAEGGQGRSIHELARKLPPGSEDLLRYDWHPRWSLLDHFLQPDARAEEFRASSYREQGDFVDQPYAASISGGGLLLERRGGVWSDDRRVEVAVRKHLSEESGALRVDYEIENLSAERLPVTFGSEWNLLAFPEEIDFADPARVALYGGRLSFEPEGARAIWSFALRTLSQSEEGFDIIHQGYCLMPVWGLDLAAGGKARFGIALKELK